MAQKVWATGMKWIKKLGLAIPAVTRFVKNGKVLCCGGTGTPHNWRKFDTCATYK